MKKAKDEMRSEYKPSNFATLKEEVLCKSGGRNFRRLVGPAIAQAFPTSKAVDEALAGLLGLAEKTSQTTPHGARRHDAHKGAHRLSAALGIMVWTMS